MKSVLDQLSESDKEALARLYDMPEWKSFRKLVDIERTELAKDHVGQRDIMEICDLSGQSKALKKLVVTIRENFKQLNKG
jgi:hypothetical protein